MEKRKIGEPLHCPAEFLKQFVKARESYIAITNSFSLICSFRFWQLKSGWENFSFWLPPFLMLCSSWNKTFETLDVLNMWKSDIPCHHCWRPVLQDSSFCAVFKTHGALCFSLYLFIEIPVVIMQMPSVLPCSYFASEVLLTGMYSKGMEISSPWRRGGEDRVKPCFFRERNGFTEVPQTLLFVTLALNLSG